MMQTHRTVPVVLYFNEVNYIQWGDMFEFAVNFATYMQQKNIEAIIFDNMYKVSNYLENINFKL